MTINVMRTGTLKIVFNNAFLSYIVPFLVFNLKFPKTNKFWKVRLLFIFQYLLF